MAKNLSSIRETVVKQRHSFQTIALGSIGCRAIVWLVLIGSAGVSSFAVADEVVVQASTARSRITITGEILEHNGRMLVIQPSAGTGQQRYRASEIVSVKTSYTSAHMSGLRLLKANRHELAQPEFENAIGQEPRTWVRREILALLIRCALRSNDFVTAGQRFEMLYESDSDTPHVSLIPLYWKNVRASGAARLKATEWLKDKQLVMRLIGASLLLFDLELAEQARDTLKELLRAPNRTVREFAWWQQKRLAIHAKEINDFDIERWEDRIDDTSTTMRAGPWFLLAQGHLIRQDFDLAAAAFLQLPFVYKTDHPMTAQACFEAGQSLERIGQDAEACRLYEEATQRFAWSAAAASAATALRELQSETDQ